MKINKFIININIHVSDIQHLNVLFKKQILCSTL